MKKIILSAMAIATVLSGCASPDVVEKTKITDQSLSCEQIRAEIDNCEKARKEAQSEKGFTGTNVAATLFFWPGLIATHMNVNDAVKALNERIAHLNALYTQKQCSTSYTR